MNKAGGFLLNPYLADDDQPNFLDRGKFLSLPTAETSDISFDRFIWAILLNRDAIPSNVEKGEISDEIKDLVDYLKSNEYVEVDIHFDKIRLGEDIKLFAKLIVIKANFDENFNYSGEAVVIKRLT
jgi:hypothetical protein